MFTLPNLVSGLRLLAVPYFWYVLVGEERVAKAAVLIFVIGGTDWVDGYLARRLNQVSEIGKFLDPLADRLMIASALIGGLMVGVIPVVIGWPLVVREAAVGVGAVVVAARGGEKLEVRPLGKVATFLLYGAIPSFYLAAAGVTPWLFGPPAWIGSVMGLLLYWYVAFQYFRDLSGRTQSLESPG